MRNMNATLDNKLPQIGMGVTICHWSDCSPGTIINISASAHKLTIQEDKATRIDKNGMSELQEYEYARDPDGRVYTAYLRQDGAYRLVRSKTKVSLFGRRKFHDYSF